MHRYLSGGFPGGSAYLFHRCCAKCGERSLFMLGDAGPCQACATCGGGDDPENVALAHLRCNIKRRIGGETQLRLVG